MTAFPATAVSGGPTDRCRCTVCILLACSHGVGADPQWQAAQTCSGFSIHHGRSHKWAHTERSLRIQQLFMKGTRPSWSYYVSCHSGSNKNKKEGPEKNPQWHLSANRNVENGKHTAAAAGRLSCTELYWTVLSCTGLDCTGLFKCETNVYFLLSTWVIIWMIWIIQL